MVVTHVEEVMPVREDVEPGVGDTCVQWPPESCQKRSVVKVSAPPAWSSRASAIVHGRPGRRLRAGRQNQPSCVRPLLRLAHALQRSDEIGQLINLPLESQQLPHQVADAERLPHLWPPPPVDAHLDAE